VPITENARQKFTSEIIKIVPFFQQYFLEFKPVDENAGFPQAPGFCG